MIYGVVLADPHGDITYGRFEEDQRDLAEAFARYLTAEVGTAEVVEFDPREAATWQVMWASPVAELLHWRVREQEHASKRGTCDELVIYLRLRQEHEALCVTELMDIPPERAEVYELTLRRIIANEPSTGT